MSILKSLYRQPMSMLTDLYQLTMAYGYWKSGMANHESVFNLFFRKNPFGGGYTIACGLEYVLEFLENFNFTSSDLNYLATLKGHDGSPMFEEAFLKYLEQLRFSCDVFAMPEGTAAFPHEPLLRIKGPIIEAQLIETPLLNMINFQTLVATKANRIYNACEGAPVMEFGLRRAQGIDGALAASRAAYIGGCTTTSNVEAGKLFGIPLSGTHAHSWVMTFDDEQTAFDTYADAMPNNCILLVDTYNVLDGVKRAIKTGLRLKEEGKKLLAIRIDSGDLAYLSRQARLMLDEAGLQETQIVASNDLDEHIVKSLKNQHASIDLWGIGTKLITAFDQPALGGVYKLAALKNEEGVWEHKIKLSEQSLKINIPGMLQVRRFSQGKEARADMIFDENFPPQNQCLIVDPQDSTKRKKINQQEYETKDLLVPVIKEGKRIYKSPAIQQIREFALVQMQGIHESIKRFEYPHFYVTGLEMGLHKRRESLILELRNRKS